MRRSKAHREFRFYSIMKSLGMNVPADVSFSEKRNPLRLLNQANIEMEALDAVDLRFFFAEDKYQELRQDKAFMKKAICAVAEQLSMMNQKHYFHLNLNFRNVLISTNVPSAPKAWFIDCTAGTKNVLRIANRMHYHRMKEVAFLYKYARHVCSLSEMVFFMHQYLGCNKLTQKHREFIQSLVAYTKKKWD